MREEGYYWCFIKERRRKDWDILYYNSMGEWILDGELFYNDKIIEIDEKQIKRE